MALTEEQRAKLNAKAQQKHQVDDVEYQEFLQFKKMQLQKEDNQQTQKKSGTKKGKTFGILVPIVIFIVCGILWFCWPAIEYSIARAKYKPTTTSSKNSNTDTSVNISMIDKPSIAVNSFGLKCIKGSLKNNTGASLSYVQITFALFDKDGAQIGTAMANINNLTKDAVWKYEASPMTLDDWASFELTEVTGW